MCQFYDKKLNSKKNTSKIIVFINYFAIKYIAINFSIANKSIRKKI
ncbi:MAG: hypothetical protein RL535_273 [Pseudomonadota bacterium]